MYLTELNGDKFIKNSEGMLVPFTVPKLMPAGFTDNEYLAKLVIAKPLQPIDEAKYPYDREKHLHLPPVVADASAWWKSYYNVTTLDGMGTLINEQMGKSINEMTALVSNMWIAPVQVPPPSPISFSSPLIFTPYKSYIPYTKPQPYVPGSNRMNIIADLFPQLSDLALSCPLSGCEENRVSVSLPSVVIHLNDDHHWSRSHIADWIDTLDIDQTPRPPTMPDLITKEEEDEARAANQIIDDSDAYGLDEHGQPFALPATPQEVQLYKVGLIKQLNGWGGFDS